jgi:adenine-specific DNA-methyltransferase
MTSNNPKHSHGANMKQLELQEGASADIVQENVQHLKELFPDAFTENGVNFDTLRQLLGDLKVLDEGEEKYGLNWHGKKQARQIALTPSLGTLLPCPIESVDWDTTQNLFIEGDNLEVLKLLQKSYANKIKMIYIDPPYNTGKEFVYPDKFQDNLDTYLKYTGQKGDEGLKFTSNTETGGRKHTNWLNMMYPRLKLAKSLLRQDGVIFISIDDNEFSNLKEVCDEIFGEENFRNIFTLKRYDKNINRQFIEGGLNTFNTGFEYVLCYSKSTEFKFSPIYRDASKERQNTGYWKGFWNDANRPTMRYEILGFTPEQGQWKWSEEKAREAINNYQEYIEKFSNKISIEEYWEKTEKNKKFIRRNHSGTGKNMGVEHWIEPSDGVLRNTSWIDIFASKATEEVKGLFDFPKNPEAMKLMIESIGKDDGIILDFFAGSASTAQAVLEKNLDEEKRYRFICVQLPEYVTEKSSAYEQGYKNIAEIGKERIRRAAKKIKDENPDYDGDLGFKVFKLASSNIKVWNPDRTDLEGSLLDHKEHLVEGRSEQDILYELLIKRGVDLTTPIKTRKIEGKNVYSIGFGKIITCLDDLIAANDVEPLASGIIAWQKELKDTLGVKVLETHVFFKDSAFRDDVAKTNMAAILSQNGIDHVRSL